MAEHIKACHLLVQKCVRCGTRGLRLYANAEHQRREKLFHTEEKRDKWMDKQGEEIMNMMLLPLEISHVISFCDSTYLVGQNRVNPRFFASVIYKIIYATQMCNFGRKLTRTKQR